jgi:hypothetical protein
VPYALLRRVVKSPPLRFVAPSAHHDSGAGYRSGSTPNTFPPRPFAGPRGVKPHPSLRSCFIPLTLMGFRSFKVFPCCRALPNSSLGAPLSVFLPLAAVKIRRFKRRVRDAPPGVYARQESVPPNPHIAACLGSIPSWTFIGPCDGSPASPQFQRHCRPQPACLFRSRNSGQPRLSQLRRSHRRELCPLRSLERSRRVTSR